ncbi:hypothetical protein GCM10022244_29760 [Streptomyces gulbargensis]|uniref:Uncharacterized protein n=1 Tax=Streptomyces gulbargensis TaxID=364901 RepID=A0ABP7MBS6_9ACTN
MPDFMTAARAVIHMRDFGAPHGQHERIIANYVEAVTFADPDVIFEDLKQILGEDWMALPVWARNLAFRLACLQQPENPELLRAAAIDLEAFGPDWDDVAADLDKRAADLERGAGKR